MAHEGFKRKLAAILSADVEGYGRLMGEDEEATVRTITAYREVMTTLIQQHNGKVLDSPGDNLLAEFVSVVDAVQCAVAVQKEFQARNVELPESRRMEFRIGINLGDVIEEKERIYGDGVNIAARLEGLAKPGGICISKTAFDHIESKLPYGYEFIGDQTVKNIAKPVGAYRVVMEPRVTVVGKPEDEKPAKVRRMPILIGAVAVLVLAFAVGIWQFYMRRPTIEPASEEKMAYPLPDKPSIAVLPFDNISGDPEQEYFSDGLTEQIITSLSRIPRMFVIARNSTFTYKGKPVKIQKIAEDLGVRYILEGGVQRSGDRVRITAQLIDAIVGHHIWSERYDRQMEDIFALQDDITMKILTALQVELTEGEQIIWARDYPGSLETYEKHIKANYYIHRGTKQDNEQAKRLIKEAMDLDPENTYVCMVSGWATFMDVKFGWSKDPEKSINLALECAKMCIANDRGMENGHSLLGAVYHLKGKYEEAISEVEQAIALGPNAADHYSLLGEITSCAGRWEEGIPIFKKAIRLNPFPPAYYYASLGRSYMMTGRYEEAIKTCKKSLGVNPDFLPAHLGLTATYILSDRVEEAKVAAAEVLRINPKFSLEHFETTLPYKNKVDIARYVAALREGGLK
jgi:adenylate cyclase